MWTYEYANDVGPGDEGFFEWWDVLRDGEKVAKADEEEIAKLICDKMNAPEPFRRESPLIPRTGPS